MFMLVSMLWNSTPTCDYCCFCCRDSSLVLTTGDFFTNRFSLTGRQKIFLNLLKSISRSRLLESSEVEVGVKEKGCRKGIQVEEADLGASVYFYIKKKSSFYNEHGREWSAQAPTVSPQEVAGLWGLRLSLAGHEGCSRTVCRQGGYNIELDHRWKYIKLITWSRSTNNHFVLHTGRRRFACRISETTTRW